MLKSARLTLRNWRLDDQVFVDAIVGDPEVMEFSDTGPLSQSQQIAWLRDILKNKPPDNLPGKLAIELGSSRQVIGYISLSRDLARVGHGEAEIGFRLAKSAWGQGYATEATERMIEAAKLIPSVERVLAIVDPSNHRSVRTIKKVGMLFEREVMFEGYDHPDHLYTRRVKP